MKTEQFEFTTGVTAGYHHGNDAMPNMGAMVNLWRQATEQVLAESGIYVSAILLPTRCVFRVDWGCPISGEPSVTVTGLRNPDFLADAGAWKGAVRRACSVFKMLLSQQTGYLTFQEVEFEYMQ